MKKPETHKFSTVRKRYSFLMLSGAFAVQVMDAIQSAWVIMPRAWSDSVPGWLVLTITLCFLGAGVVGSFIQQDLREPE